jgi:tetratricopeptide (TPR) repeat protein
MSWLRDALGRLAGTGEGRQPDAAPPAGPPATDWKALGNAALAAGDLAEAARCYAQGVLAQPADAALRLNLGYVLLEQRQYADAAERLQQALALRRPGDDFAHEAHYLLGRAEAALQRFGPALASLQAALKASPDFAPAVEEGVRVLHQLQRHAEAAQWAERLLALRPCAFVRLLLGNELARCGCDARAAQLAAEVTREEPANLDAAVLLFNSLFRLGRFDEALVEAQRVLALAGPDPGALVNVAAALEKVGRLDEALVHLDEALRIEPGRRDALVNRVGLLIEQARLPAAIAAARGALQSHPQDADLHWNLSIAHLLLGDFQAGWAESEWRTRSVAFRGEEQRFAAPRWQGENLRGRAIFLHGEQGFGDNIQFVRYVSAIAPQARAVYLQVPQPLEPLMQDLAPNCHLLQQGALLPAIDFHCPLMSLPAVLGTRLETIPAHVPYLRADAARVRAWRERLPRDVPNVGIAWAGKPSHVNDHNRSMTLATFRAIDTGACRFVTVQPQLRDADRAALSAWPQALDLGRELRDFADTAALVEALDLVVSVDTGVAHLTGALGKPVWILLPQAPDWRWMLKRQDSPWYPTARLYRQGAAGDWAPVLARVQGDLARL